MEIPPELLSEFDGLLETLKSMTSMVLRECHDPDFQVMQDKISVLFNKLETETFQLDLFNEQMPTRTMP